MTTSPRWRAMAVLLTAAVLAAGCGDGEEAPTQPPPSPSPSPPSEQYRQHRSAALDLYRGGDLQGALGQAARALAAGPDQPEAYQLVSRIYVETGDDESAVEFFTIGTRNLPDAPYSWRYKGFHEFRLNRWSEALASYERAAALDPRDPEPWFRQGLILQAMGDFDSALEHLRRAHELDPDDAVAAARLARLLRITGSYDEAEQVVSVALLRSPESSDLHYALGQLRLREGRDREAEHELREAIRLNPRRSDARLDLARLLARSGRGDESVEERIRAERLRDWAESRDALLRLLAMRPDDPEVVLALAETELTENALADAERWLRRADQLNAPRVRLTADQIELAVRRESLDEAEALLARVGATDPRTMLAAAALALGRGQTDRGLGFLRSALTHGPDERAFLRRAADLYRRAGRPDEARALLERAAGAPAGLAAEGASGMGSDS